MRKTMTEMQLDFCLGKAGYLPTDETSHLVNSYSGDTPWPDLDDLVYADDDAIFNEDYEEVDEEEEEDQ